MSVYKKTSKSGKLRELICEFCKSTFLAYIAPSSLKAGRGKVCSKECKNLLNGIKKRKGNYKSCEVCKKTFWCRPVNNKKGNKHYRKHCSKECFKNKPTKKGRINGNFISFDGYVVIMRDGRQIKEHRWIMQQHLGRKLLSSEIVHHKDHDKLNNKIENLEITTRAEHNRIHFKNHHKYNDGLNRFQRYELRKKGLINY